MRRLNLKLLVSLVVGLLVMVASVHVIHGIQVDKNAGVLKKEAETAELNGEKGLRLAVKKYGQYLKHRPMDVAAQEKFALLANDLANAPDSSQDDKRLAYRALDIAAKHPELIEVRRRIIDYYIRLGRYVDALEYLDKLRAAALENGKREPDLDVKFARCQVVLGHHEKALAVLDELVGYDKTTKTFDADVAVAPWEIEAYMTLADVLRRRLDDSDMADEVMQQLVVANPLSADAYLRLGRYLRQTNPLKAIDAFDRALELAPDDADVILEVADIGISRREFDRTRPMLEAALKSHPDRGEMYRAMAALTLAEGKGDKDAIAGAIEQVMTGLEHAPNNPTLMIFLVDLQMMKGDFSAVKDAIERMRTARMVPEFIAYYEAQLAVRQQKWSSAAAQLEKLRPSMSRMPDKIMEIDLALGQCYENLGQPDRQAEAFRRVMDLQPNYPAARFGHARALMAMGKRKEGMAELVKVDRDLRANNLPGPQVRSAILQGRVTEQLQKPAKERKWDDIDKLVDETLSDESVDELRKARFRVEMAAMKGDLDQAKALMEPLLKEYPKEVNLWLNWFSILERIDARDYKVDKKQTPEERQQLIHAAVEQGLSRISEAEKIAGDQAAFRVMRAAALSRLPAEEAAPKLAELEQGIDEYSAANQLVIWEGLGNAYQRLRDYDNVKRCFRKLVDNNPDNLTPWENMFDVATVYGDEKGAQEAADQIRRISGGAGSPIYKYCVASQLIAKVVSDVQRKDFDQAREKERLDEARKKVEDIRRVRPDWHQAYRLEGEINDLEGHVEAAIENYQKALELGSTNANTSRRVVMLLFQQGRMPEVQAALKHVSRDSSTPMLEKMDVESKFRTGDRETALRMAKDTIDALPEDSEPRDAAIAHVWYGNLLVSDNHPEEAEQQFRTALEKQPESSQLWMLLIGHLATASKKAEAAGNKEEAAEKKAQAVEAIAGAKKAVPEKDQPLLMSQAYEAIGETDQAESFLLAIQKENPYDLNFTRRIAEFYLRYGKNDQAREQIEVILGSKVDDQAAAANRAWARRSLAGLLARQGNQADVEKAIQLVQQNTTDGKGSAADVRFIATILANRPDPESLATAISLFERLADQQAISVQERLNLAMLYDRAGDWPKARDQIYALLAKMPKNPAVLSTWIQMQAAHDEVDHLDKWIEKLEEAAPKSDVAMQLKVRWLAKQGKNQEAIAYLNGLGEETEALTDPLDAEQIALLGRVGGMLEQLEDYPSAEKYMRKWYENDPQQTLAFGAFLGRRGQMEEAFELFDKVRKESSAAPAEGDTAKEASDDDDESVVKKSADEKKPEQADPAAGPAVPPVFLAAVQCLRLHPGKASAPQQKLLEQWLTEAIEEKPKSIPFRFLMIDLKDVQSRYDESMKLYRSLLDDSDLSERQQAIVKNNLAFLLVTRGNKDSVAEARKLVDEAVEHFGPIGGVLDTRGMVLMAEGNPKSAVEDFKVAVAEAPTAISYFHLALADDKIGDAAGTSEAIAKADELKLDTSLLPARDQRDYKRIHNGQTKAEEDATKTEKDAPAKKPAKQNKAKSTKDGQAKPKKDAPAKPAKEDQDEPAQETQAKSEKG